MSEESKTGYEAIQERNAENYYRYVLDKVNKLNSFQYAQLRAQLLICATKEEFKLLMSS